MKKELILLSLNTGIGFAGWIIILYLLNTIRKASSVDGEIVINANKYGEMYPEIILSILFLVFLPVSTGYLLWKNKQEKKESVEESDKVFKFFYDSE